MGPRPVASLTGEQVQEVVECFSAHMAASTWPVLPVFVFTLFAGLPFDLSVAAIVLVQGKSAAVMPSGWPGGHCTSSMR
jgi:hypothetical protein